MSTLCYGCFEELHEGLDICPHCGYEDGERPGEALHLAPGHLLKDTYIIGKVLGYGGFGVTYLGWNSVLEQKVAIKEYLPSEFSTRMPGNSRVTVFNGEKSEQFSDGVNKFVEEANKLAKFRNTDGIVRIYESFHENNTAYIIMEYLDGQTLTKYLGETGQIPAEKAVQLLTPIIQSLQLVHEHGIIHRDIAPDNIMVTKDGGVKLIDFGAARYATTSRSRSLTVVIKPGYSPEEQYRSRGDQGPWTDVYAVGATLYRMITGLTPPDAMERRAFFEGKKKDILTPVGKATRKISSNQETAILNAMNVRIEDRTQDMAAFERELSSKTEVKRRYGKIKKVDMFKWPLWLKIVAPAAACAVIVLSYMFITGMIGFDSGLRLNSFVPAGMVKVPSVINNDIEKARQRIQNQLNLQIAGKEESDEIKANLILSQDLRAGSVVAINSILSVKVSAGRLEIVTEIDDEGKLPLADVQFRTKDEAIRALESQGMIVVIREEFSEMVASGVVIFQDPGSGTRLEPGTEVTIVVSKGSRPFEMPGMSGMTESDARAELISKGLVVNVVTETSDFVPAGTVIRQSIPEGAEVSIGDTVTIIVSSGRNQNTPPGSPGQAQGPGTTQNPGAGQDPGTPPNSGAPQDPAASPGSAVWGEWSGWSASYVAADANTEIETKQQYRSREREITTSEYRILSGWEYYYEELSTEETPWSAWSTSQYSPSDTIQVESKTQYRFRDITEKDVWGEWSDWSTTVYTQSGTRNVESKEQTSERETLYGRYETRIGGWGPWEDGRVEPETEIFIVDYTLDPDPENWYSETVEINRRYRTVYRYQDLTTQPVTGAWSGWSDEPVAASSTREVEQQTLYRFRESAIVYYFYRWGEWTGWLDGTPGGGATSADRETQTQTVYRYRTRAAGG